jgi:PAS domain S-box-containing protein
VSSVREAHLSRELARYKELVDRANELVLVVRREGSGPFIVTSANAVALAMRLFPEEPALGAPMEVQYPVSHALVLRELDRVLAFPTPVRFVERMELKRGGTRWFEIALAAVQADADVDVIAVARDVTQIRETEARLVASEERFRRFFEQPLVAALIFDSRGRVVEVNDTCCVLLERSREQLCGATWMDLTHPDDIAPELADLQRAVRGEIEMYQREKRFLLPNGSFIWGRIFTSFTRHADGRIDLSFTTGIDITAARAAEAKLVASEAKFRKFFEMPLIGAAIFDARGCITEVNEHAARSMGYTREEMMGRPSTDFVDGDIAEERENIRRMARGETDSFASHKLHRRKDGTHTHAHVVTKAIRDEYGRVAGGYSVSVDLDPVVKARAELEALNRDLEARIAARTAELAAKNAELEFANDRLREVDRLKSEFLATMSHELRTPLNAILGFSSILLAGMTGPLSGEQHKQLSMVKDSARHLLGLINDLLDVARIESGRMVVERSSFQVELVLRKLVASMAPQASDRSVALSLDCHASVSIESDERRFSQIVLNLLSNAVKFTPSGGRVDVALTPLAAGFEVAVTDTGIGIRADQRQHLFEAFRQLDGSARRVYEGTGLGLHLSRRLALLLGGTLELRDSEPGRGSTFVATFALEGPHIR